MAQWMLAQQESSLLLPMRSFSGLPLLLLWCCPPSSPLLLAVGHLPFPSALSVGSAGWLLNWSWVGEWGGDEGAGGGGGGGGGVEMS